MTSKRVAPDRATASASLSAPPLRVLVIGAGGMATYMHLPILKKLADRGAVALCVVCDIRDDRAGEARTRFGFQDSSSDGVGSISRDDIDAVYIFGSAQIHHEYGLLALERGKHLFVEKPIAPSYAAARELADNAEQRGLIAVGGHNRRFFPAFAAACEETGRAGWRFIEATFHKPEFGRAPPFGARSWLTANGIHALDAIVFMAGGLPAELAAIAETAGSSEPRNFSAVMRWPDGCQASFLCDNSAGSREEEYVLHGLGLTCTVASDRLRIEKSGQSRDLKFDDDPQGFFAEHEAFLSAIREPHVPVHAISNLAPSLYLAELVENGYRGTLSLPARFSKPDASKPVSIARTRSSPGKSVLVINPAALRNVLPLLAAEHRIVSIDEVQSSPDARLDIAAAIIGRGGKPIPEDVLEKLPNLSFVGIAGLSISSYGDTSLFARKIAVANASEAYARTVAEFALGLALLGRRRAFLSHERMREGGWGLGPSSRFKSMALRLARSAKPIVQRTPFEPFMRHAWNVGKSKLNLVGDSGRQGLRDLSRVTVGLLGWSANAKVFVELLRPFDVTVKVFTEHASDSELDRAGVQKAVLAEVLAADIVSLHRGLTADTRYFLGAAELECLRPGAVLINVARGALIQPRALLERLRRGDIFACLDTFEKEPLPRSDPLRKLPNVFLTPHIAGATLDMHESAARLIVEKTIRYLQGDEVETISVEQWRTMT